MSGLSATGGGHSLFGRWLYSVLWIVCRAVGVSVFGVRTRFAEPLPGRGGLIVLSSHQSHLDPLLLGGSPATGGSRAWPAVRSMRSNRSVR